MSVAELNGAWRSAFQIRRTANARPSDSAAAHSAGAASLALRRLLRTIAGDEPVIPDQCQELRQLVRECDLLEQLPRGALADRGGRVPDQLGRDPPPVRQSRAVPLPLPDLRARYL